MNTSWTSDSECLLTVSRDGHVKLWKLSHQYNNNNNSNNSNGCTDYTPVLECVYTLISPFQGISVTCLDITHWQHGDSNRNRHNEGDSSNNNRKHCFVLFGKNRPSNYPSNYP